MRSSIWNVLGSLVAVVVLAGACSSAKKIESGEACTLNSDCNSPLVCTMGKCHQGCRETRDCPVGQSCVIVEGAGVCQLPDEASCVARPCATGFVCAVDQRCHTGCLSPADCSKGQVCIDSVCADSSQLVDGVLPASAPAQPDAGVDAGLPDAPLAPADATPDVDTDPHIISFVSLLDQAKPTMTIDSVSRAAEALGAHLEMKVVPRKAAARPPSKPRRKAA